MLNSRREDDFLAIWGVAKTGYKRKTEKARKERADEIAQTETRLMLVERVGHVVVVDPSMEGYLPDLHASITDGISEF